MLWHRISWSVVVALCLFLGTTVASTSTGSDSNNTTLPSCAATCEQQLLKTHTTCAANDTNCLCADSSYQTHLQNCAQSSCAPREALIAKRVNSRQCHIPPHKARPEADAATMVPFILATVFFLNRIIIKFMHLGGAWGPDDYTVIVAYALMVIIYAINMSMIHYGLGQNMWDIVPMDNITAMNKRFYAFVVLYKVQISLTKISVCLFLLRIFYTTSFRYTTYAIIGVNVAIPLAWIFVDCFRCIPVHLAWTQWESTEKGTCVDFNLASFVHAIVNLIVDAVIVVLPIYDVLRLRLSTFKKLGVALMFMLGLALTAIASYRAYVFYPVGWATNPSVQLEPGAHWSVIETQVSIIVACLPAARALLVRFFPGTLGSKLRGGFVKTSHYGDPVSGSGSGSGSGGAGAAAAKVSKTVSYSVDFSSRSHVGDDSGFIRLVEVGPPAAGAGNGAGAGAGVGKV